MIEAPRRRPAHRGGQEAPARSARRSRYVDKIKRPLLIGQGANDPRVKQAEADQIVEAMKAKRHPGHLRALSRRGPRLRAAGEPHRRSTRSPRRSSPSTSAAATSRSARTSRARASRCGKARRTSRGWRPRSPASAEPAQRTSSGESCSQTLLSRSGWARAFGWMPSGWKYVRSSASSGPMSAATPTL